MTVAIFDKRKPCMVLDYYTPKALARIELERKKEMELIK